MAHRGAWALSFAGTGSEIAANSDNEAARAKKVALVPFARDFDNRGCDIGFDPDSGDYDTEFTGNPTGGSDLVAQHINIKFTPSTDCNTLLNKKINRLEEQ